MQNQKNKVTIKDFISLHLFALVIIIVIILWLFQFLLTNIFYKEIKKQEIQSLVEETSINFDNNRIYPNMNYDRDICISLVTKDGIAYDSQSKNRCNLSGRYDDTKESFIKSNEKEHIYTIKEDNTNHTMYLYAYKTVKGNYVFVLAELMPLETTKRVLQIQMVFVTALVLILIVWLSQILTKTISKPLTSITKSAKLLEKDLYDVNFDTDFELIEFNELSNSLNSAKNELSKTDEMRRDIMANISHDFKTPLTMIRAYSEMVRDITYKDNKKREENLNTIIEETDRLTNLVNDVLDLSKAEAIKDLQLERFNLNELIDSIINRFQIFKQTENYEFITNYNKDINYIKADKAKLEQVIYNLISNAINYTGDDNKVYIDITNEGKFIKVSIRDTGKGIKSEDLPNIWDKYYKSEKKHKRNQIGTGLGLHIVKTILEKHKFEYGVDTKLKEGTTFWFKIKETN